MDEEHVDSTMVMLETNLDDMPGEWMGYVLEKLFKSGAKDAYYTPILMKKNRPAYKLSVLVSEEDLDSVATIVFHETTTLGIRYFPVTCHRLGREFFKVDLGHWGAAVVKVGKKQGELVQIAPEYEDCALIARAQNIPLKEVYDRVKSEVFKQYPALKK